MAKKSSKAPEQIAQPARFDNQLPKLDVAGSSPVARSLADSTAAFLPPQEAYVRDGGGSTARIFSVPNPRAGCVICHAPAKEYHQWEENSCSDLKELVASPLGYYLRKIAQSAPPKTSDAMTYGTLVHDWHEETNFPAGDTDSFFSSIEICPQEFELATGNLSKKGDEWLRSLPAGKRGMTGAMRDRLWQATRQMLANEAARDLFRNRVDTEFCIRTTWNGHPVRGRIDGATEAAFYDLKTTSDPQPLKTFWKSVSAWQYDLQAAFYEELASQAGWPPHSLHFVITQSVFPYACHVVTLPRAVTDKARERVVALLDDLRTRREWGSWYPDDYGRVTELDCPGFMKGGGFDGGEW